MIPITAIHCRSGVTRESGVAGSLRFLVRIAHTTMIRGVDLIVGAASAANPAKPDITDHCGYWWACPPWRTAMTEIQELIFSFSRSLQANKKGDEIIAFFLSSLYSGFYVVTGYRAGISGAVNSRISAASVLS